MNGPKEDVPAEEGGLKEQQEPGALEALEL